MNAIFSGEKQIEIAVSAPFAFSTARISASSFSDSFQTRDDVSSQWRAEQVRLYGAKYVVRFFARQFQ